MKTLYCLGLDVAKHKLRAALCGSAGAILFEADLPVSAGGRAELLALLRARVPQPEQLLVVLEATGVLHLNWSAALAQAGYAVVVINPLIARRFYPIENALRDSKTDPIDARGLCALGLLHGEKLLCKYRFQLEPERLALQRLQTVRKALRTSLTNLKKTYTSLLDLSFPELGQLLEVDGTGIRALLQKAPTPGAIAQKRLSTLEKDWKLRPKAAPLKALAADSLADPELAAAGAPALQAILQSIAALEAQLRALDKQIEARASQGPLAQSKALLETIPGFGPTLATKVLAYLPHEILHSGSRRQAAARLQALWETNRASRKAASGKDKPK